MADPRLARRGDALYLVDAAGAPWRVHDVAFHAHKHKRVELGSAAANHRYFIAKDGTRKACVLTPKADRSLTVENLAQQLRAAGFVAREKFDGGVIDPR